MHKVGEERLESWSEPRHFKIPYYTGSAIPPSRHPGLREIANLPKLELVPKFREIRYTDKHSYGFSFCPGILFKAAEAVVPEFRDQFQLDQFRIFAESFDTAWRLPG